MSSQQAVTSLPARPGTGRAGRPIKVIANHFAVSSLPVGEIVQYTVDVTPDVPRSMRRRLFTQLEERYLQAEFGGILVAYDGMSNMYSRGPLPKDQYSLVVELPGRRKDDEPRRFQFRMRRVSSVNIEAVRRFLENKTAAAPHDAVTALEVVLRHSLCESSVVVGRSIYTGKTVEPISGGVDVWRGVFLSLRPGVGRLLLNVDSSAAAFVAGGELVPIVRDVLGVPKHEWDRFNAIVPRDRATVERFLHNARVEVTHRQTAGDEGSRRRYKVLGLSPSGASETFFEDHDGKRTSVAQYFSDKYGVALKHPGLPCVAVGSPQRPVHLPMEVCRIPPGQRFMRKLNPQQTSDMIRIANRRPEDRLRDLCTDGRDAVATRAARFLDAFGIKIDMSTPLTVDGRVLQPPTIFYGKQSREASIVPRDGTWNLRDKAMDMGATLRAWSVLVFGRAPDAEVKAFVHELVDTAIATGMPVTQRAPPILFATRDLEQSLRDAYDAAAKAGTDGSGPQIVVCILPTDDAALYGDIKCFTDTVLGLPSQCMLMKHIRRPNKQYCANLLLKINLKLGGVNSSLGREQLAFVTSAPTMVIGADVTHPGIGEGDKPSIAAVVASMDAKMSRYAAAVRMQGSRVEIIAEMGSIFKELIAQFVATHRIRPRRILVYRDGVSEGQYAQVLDAELGALKEACRQMSADEAAPYEPKVTFVIVGKRHHTRLFVTRPQDADRSGNVPAGTLVDTAIVHPSQYDFFLCSHAGLQGTSRPAHYHVVHDENGIAPDDMYALSYNLCHTFGRCTRSVSVVTPAYYAHLVAFRARFHAAGPGGFRDVRPELAPHMYFI